MKKYYSDQELYDGDAVFAEIMLNWDKLSAEIKDKLAPFYANPSDKNGKFRKRDKGLCRS